MLAIIVANNLGVDDFYYSLSNYKLFKMNIFHSFLFLFCAYIQVKNDKYIQYTTYDIRQLYIVGNDEVIVE